MTGQPLWQCFDLIFGTSTGAIIAALLALGRKVSDVRALYERHVPRVMQAWPTRAARSRALEALAKEVFAEARFEDVKTGIGIVVARWEFETPMIFKASSQQAHGRHASFIPGFGCSIADAVQASCSAYPFFEKKVVTTDAGHQVTLIDGGYCANNPTLYAIADAVMAFERNRAALRVVSIGVGVYPEPKRFGWQWLVRRVPSVKLLQKTLDINTLSMEKLRSVLCRDVQTVRINDTFERPEMATDLMEHDLTKLNQLYQRGCESFAQNEQQLRAFLL